jgi:hypothetical protein
MRIGQEKGNGGGQGKLATDEAAEGAIIPQLSAPARRPSLTGVRIRPAFSTRWPAPPGSPRGDGEGEIA